jgi:glycosyltransferase involved in cell wall biosynthesis
MEALACGVPVIAGPTNGTAEYASPSSFLFREYTAESVLAAMRRAVAAVRADRAGLAADARRTAEAHFRPEAVAARVVELLHRVAPAGASRAGIGA